MHQTHPSHGTLFDIRVVIPTRVHAAHCSLPTTTPHKHFSTTLTVVFVLVWATFGEQIENNECLGFSLNSCHRPETQSIGWFGKIVFRQYPDNGNNLAL